MFERAQFTLRKLTLVTLALGLSALAAAGTATQEKTPVIADHGDPYTLSTDPVSGKALGKLEDQITLRHQGREFRFANEENSKAFQSSPETHVARVDKQIIAAQGKAYPLTTCPVSGEKLGAMGDPLDLVVGNRLVRVCCKGCIKGVLKDRDAAIAKLDAAVVKSQLATYTSKICAVSGRELGGMGKPIDLVIANKLVRLCCKGCIKKVKADPLKYLGASSEVAGGKAAGGCCSESGEAAGAKKAGGCGGVGGEPVKLPNSTCARETRG